VWWRDPKCLTWTTAKPWFVAEYIKKKKEEEAVALAEKKFDPKTTTILVSNPPVAEKEKFYAKTTEIVGSHAVAEMNIDHKTRTIVDSNEVKEKEEKVKKGEIRDRLIERYKAEQEIEKRKYDANPPKKGSSDDEMEEDDEDDEDMYDGMHPIDYKTKQNLTYLRALAELKIPPVEGKCWCFLSKVNRQWHWKHKVTNHIWGTCHINCRPFDSRQSLVNHLREGDAMHKYTLEFLEEWWKKE
jgi:hypothetical protein